MTVRVGKRVLLDSECRGIDARDLVCAELVEPGTYAGVDHDSVRPRILCWRFHQPHLSRFRIQVSDEIRELRGEPHLTVPIECHRVGIASSWIWHAMDGGL